MSQNVATNPSLIEKKLKEINQISEKELSDLLLNSYQYILDKDFIDSHEELIASVFSNEKFVTIFSRIIAGNIKLTPSQRINCNRLIYDYTVFSGRQQHIMELLYNLASYANRDTLPSLLGLGLNQWIATDLVVARFSTSKESLAMKRVNVVIINSPLAVMTEQMIVNIYDCLFSHLSQMTEGIMFDVWSDDDFVDEEKEEIYGTISLALLDILNDMPMQMIVKVLIDYAQTRQYLYTDRPVRFNIKSISVSDYKRILDAIIIVEQTGLMMPA